MYNVKHISLEDMIIVYNKICYTCGFTSDPVLELLNSIKYECCPVCNSKLHKLNLFNGIKLSKMSINDVYAWIERQTGNKVPDEMREQVKEYVHAKYLESLEKHQRSSERQASSEQYKISKMNPNNIHCPTCGSNRVEKISGFDRAMSAKLFGYASDKIGKTFECKSCGYKW